MRKKQFFSFIIVLSIILSLVAPVYAERENSETQTVTVTQRQADALSALRVFGFISDEYTEDVISEFGNVTRARFAEFANKVYFFDATSDNIYFHDVSRNHYAYSSISALVERGIISQNNEKLFRPDDLIRPDEAAKIIIYSLGYKSVCEESENNMAEARRLANSMKLFDGISFDGNELTFYDMLLMVYNSLLVELPSLIGYQQNDGETFLSKYYDIFVQKGRVEGADGISVFGEHVNDGDVLINGEAYSEGELDMVPYLAKNIQFFYKNEKDENKTVMWVKEANNNEELILERENLPEYNASQREIEYLVNEKVKTAKLSDSAEVIYNGARTQRSVQDILSDDFYQIRLVKIDDSKYDICFIDSYKNYIVASNQPSDDKIYLKSMNPRTANYEYKMFDLSEYDRVDIILPDKTKGEQNQISDKTVVSVYESDDRSRIKLVSSLASVKGSVKYIDNSEAYQKIYIDDTSYTSYSKELKFSFSPGANVNIMLDTYGYIADIEISSGTARFGFVTKKAMDDAGVEVSIKLFDASSGKLTDMACAERVKIDGITYKSADEIYMAISAEPQLIAFTTSNDSKIVMIDTAEMESDTVVREKDNMLVKKNAFSSLQYTDRARTFGPKIRVDGSTTFISVPKNPSAKSTEKDFGIGSVSYFSAESYYDVEAYEYGIAERKEFCDVLLCNSVYFYSEYWVSNKFLVDKVSSVYDEDEDEVVCQISGYHGSTYKTLNCTTTVTDKIKSGVYNVTKGDLLSITNETGHIDDFSVVYGPSTTARPTSAYSLHLGRQTCFYPIDIVGTTIFGGINGMEFEEIFTKGNATVFVYDSATGTISQGSLADIRTYEVYGNQCSTVYYYAVSGEVRNFVIYN